MLRVEALGRESSLYVSKTKKKKKYETEFDERQATDCFAMSRPPNGSNGYTNGYHSQEQSNRYEENHQDVSPIEGSRERRAGGYGGFANENPSAPDRYDRDSPSRPDAPDPETYNSYTRSRFEEKDSNLDNGSRGRERNVSAQNNGRSQRDGPGSRQIEGQ